MTEQKAKKVADTKAASAVSGKPKNTKPKNAKPGVTAAAKKTVIKKAPAKITKAAGKAPSKVSGKVKTSAEKKTANRIAKPSAPRKKPAKPSPEERYRMVEMTAYFIAERNGFRGDSTEHWAAAEREIAAKLGQ